MRKGFLLLTALVLFVTAFAQQKKYIDSLLTEIDKHPPDSVLVDLYDEIGQVVSQNNPTKAIEYLEKGKAIAEKARLQIAYANFWYSIGFNYRVKGKYDQAIHAYQQSLPVYEQRKDSFRLANALMSIQSTYFELNDLEKAKEYMAQAAPYIFGVNDLPQVADFYGSIATINSKQNKYDSALYYYQKAIDLNKSFNDPIGQSIVMMNKGLTLKKMGQYQQALQYFDSSIAAVKDVEQMADLNASIKNNIGATYAMMGQTDKALAAFNTSIQIAREAGLLKNEMENYRNMSDLFLKNGDYKNHSAYLQKYYAIKDSIFTIDSKNQITQLEADYEITKKNNELLVKETEVTRNKSQRNIFIILSATALAILLTLGYFYTRIKKANKLLNEKNILINEQKNELLTLNRVKDRLFSIISHDLRQPLQTLKSFLILSDNKDVAEEKKREFKILTFNAVLNTSDMLDNLLAWANIQLKNTTPPITTISIEDSIWDVTEGVKPQTIQKGITVVQHIQAATAMGNYDILQIAVRNIVTNAIKFSPANSTITISSVKDKDKVYVSIADQGIGMTPEQIRQIETREISSTKGTAGERGSGLGLFLVKELLEKINAGITISSEPGKGSTFNIVLDA
ncbi:tetratricopeptide repeat protein [Terrimonas rubra]|uniref:histidine kinase n=1 Tax=Terrimonas rubra TaxID=1035890 RepID=A0ABW6A9H1_9BACT